MRKRRWRGCIPTRIFRFRLLRNRRLGHDVLTTQDTGQAGQATSDQAVLEFAHRENRVLLTLNRKHFIRLHSQTQNAGIIVCTFDPDFTALARRIHESIERESDLSQKLIRVNRPSSVAA